MLNLSSSASLCFLISALALVGSFVAWSLWFEFGGWHRQSHLGEEILWLLSSTIGWLMALNAMRIDRCVRLVSGFSMVLLILHTLSLCLLWQFVTTLASGGPRHG